MLPHPTHDRLIALGLVGMAKAFEEQRQQPAVAALTFEERLGLLVDREAVERQSKRLVTRLKFASLRQNATVEDLNTKAARGLDKALFVKLATGDWIGRRQDLLITGKTGTGKSWLACALGNKACRDDRSVLYYRVPRLLDALALARGDGRYARLLKSLARVELLILDDWGLARAVATDSVRRQLRDEAYSDYLQELTNAWRHDAAGEGSVCTVRNAEFPDDQGAPGNLKMRGGKLVCVPDSPRRSKDAITMDEREEAYRIYDQELSNAWRRPGR